MPWSFANPLFFRSSCCPVPSKCPDRTVELCGLCNLLRDVLLSRPGDRDRIFRWHFAPRACPVPFSAPLVRWDRAGERFRSPAFNDSPLWRVSGPDFDRVPSHGQADNGRHSSGRGERSTRGPGPDFPLRFSTFRVSRPIEVS